MKISKVKLPKSEQFICMPKQVKELFSEIEDLSVHFGSLRKKFIFDGRCPKRPKLKGQIVASYQVSRQLTSILSFYAQQREMITESIAQEFAEQILPKIKNWSSQRLAKNEIEILGVEQLLIELNEKGFKIHELRFL